MQLIIERSAIVITPSVGAKSLEKCIDSVLNQTHTNIKHLVVADGNEHFPFVADKVKTQDERLSVTIAPFKTGGNGYNGQRIYASYPHLVDADYVFFCDEDNWFEPEHVESIIETLERGHDFAFSLRKIFSKEGEYVCDDNCESLGKWPIFFTHDDPQFLIDTSSYGFKKEFIQKTCHLWHSGPWGEDRRYLYSVYNQASWWTSGLYTLCYRLGGNENSVSQEFFHEGNKQQQERYKGKYPWVRP